jgi:IMP and pyridine-specific 5'-nucleotidase
LRVLQTKDGTIYDDGKNLEPNNPIIDKLVALMKAGITVVIVTAG